MNARWNMSTISGYMNELREKSERADHITALPEQVLQLTQCHPKLFIQGTNNALLEHIGLRIGQSTILGLIDKRIGQILLASRNWLTSVNIEEGHRAQQLSAILGNRFLDIVRRNVLIHYQCQITRQLLVTGDWLIAQSGWYSLIQPFQIKLTQIGPVRQIIALLDKGMHLTEYSDRAKRLLSSIGTTREFQQSTASWMERR